MKFFSNDSILAKQITFITESTYLHTSRTKSWNLSDYALSPKKMFELYFTKKWLSWNANASNVSNKVTWIRKLICAITWCGNFLIWIIKKSFPSQLSDVSDVCEWTIFLCFQLNSFWLRQSLIQSSFYFFSIEKQNCLEMVPKLKLIVALVVLIGFASCRFTQRRRPNFQRVVPGVDK